MVLGVAGTKYYKVPTTTAKAKLQRIVLEPLARNPRGARALKTLLSGILNFGVPSTSHTETHKIYVFERVA
jgi:hypothetical protein